jgi:hypothetical protein
MKKLNFFLLPVLLLGCEFRPSGYYLNANIETTKCIYPIPSIHTYDLNESSIITCKYNSSNNVKKETFYDANTLKNIALITYSYKKTYYVKTIYDYELGSPENNYIIDKYYINR